MAELRAAGFAPLLIGGWAEEILGVATPRSHEDVDLLLIDPPLARLDAFVAARDEIVDGHLSHKRAYRHEGVKVELFIAVRSGSSVVTTFWGRLAWAWPDEMEPSVIDGLAVAPASALRSFRQHYHEFMAARDAAVAGDA